MKSEVPEETPIILVPDDQPKRKPFRLNKWHVVTVVLVAVIVAQGFLCVSLNSRYDMLNADHRSLTSDHQSLTGNYEALTNQYSALQSERSALQSSYDSLQTNLSSLRTDYSSLQATYNSLQNHHASLQSDHNSLQSSYDSLQSSYNSYVSSYYNLQDQINLRILHYSDTNIKNFITPTDSTVSAKVIEITGGWSNPSDWNEYWSDIKKMYDWIVNNIEYRSDSLFPVLPSTPSGHLEYGQEMWQYSNETLSLMQGDCEDMAILLTSMILSYNGGEYWTECIIIESSTSGHAGVQLLVEGNKLTILDPAGKYYTQTSGNIDHKIISTEISNWLNYWRPQMGNDVYVARVFSSYVDRSFSSTNEYFSWMYGR